MVVVLCPKLGLQLGLRDGVARYRAGIPPIIIWHGDIDPLVHYQNAVDIAANYSAVGAEAELHECVGQKHDAWRCKTAEGGCCTLVFSLFYMLNTCWGVGVLGIRVALAWA